ncbi:MAG: ferric reductase-like transmembrane domain-containing protein [Patescibacteria group bacterium]|jgi:predicted ferric reductase
MGTKHLGDRLIILIALLTVLIFLGAKQDISHGPTNPLLFFSQLFAVLGAVLFSLSFVISSRARFIERLLDGLSDAYKTHHFIGALGFTLLINHPVLLILKAFFNESSTKLYFLPVGPVSYSYGIIALYSLIALIVVTLFINLPYNTWKFTHTFMGLSLIFALAHVFNIQSDVSRNLALEIWVKAFLLLGCLAYLYKILLYRKLSGSYLYKLVGLDTTGKVLNLFAFPKGKPITFSAGQYAFIRVLDNKGISREEHPFSIVEQMTDGKVTFSIKKSGDYTNRLDDLKVGNSLQIIGPFGLIHKKINTKQDCVFIAGGIGITPFVGAVKVALDLGRKAYLFYSIREQSENLYDDRFRDLSGKSDKLHYELWMSNVQGRLSISSIQDKVGALDNKLFLICGPKAMMYDLSKQLKEKGVKSENIYMEDFALR